MRITAKQFEELRALVIKETGASISFYEKKEFKGKLEGYTLFEPDGNIRICLCRSDNKSFYNRAALVLLHEYGHIIDSIKNDKQKRIVAPWSEKFDPAIRYKNHHLYSKEEKINAIKDEWYADFYAIKFAKDNNFLNLVSVLELEQTLDVRYIYAELVLGKKVTKKMRKSWKRELKQNMKYVTLDDIDRLKYV